MSNVNMPESKKKGAMETAMMGLGIAGAVTGMKKDMAAEKASKDQSEAMKRRQEQLNSGGY